MMWWKIGNFIFLVSTVYMELTLGVKIVEQIDVTIGVCFTGVAVTISVLGYQWLERFRIRRVAEAERIRRWREITEKIKGEGAVMFHHRTPEHHDFFNTTHVQPKPKSHFVNDEDCEVCNA